ncbi:MAG TPA: SGNH/GDSL hydrolase family protein, partial [Pseudomonadales bacterium]|nr:SGNH/GDSL hydrolase family protein [Pseudomonadales bacterium]
VECTIRTLQAYGYVPVFNKKTIDKGNTPNKRVNAKLIRSSNPILFMEFDRHDPNINNAGFRGSDFAINKPPLTTRIAILGDSVAYGYSVPLEETFARLLEKQLNQDKHTVEVLNFAVNGYSTVAELELYKTRVREYQPDIVLLAYVLNDPLPASFVVQSVGSARKQADDFQLLSQKTQLGAWIFLKWQEIKQKIDQKNNYHSMYANKDLWNTTTQSLAELSALTKQDGAKFGVVVFPLLLDFNNYPMHEIHKQINDTLQADGIPHIDLLNDFSAIPYMDLRPHPNDDTHPNALGHAIAAKRITQFIEEKLLPTK